jgi:hypothetical protein
MERRMKRRRSQTKMGGGKNKMNVKKYNLNQLLSASCVRQERKKERMKERERIKQNNRHRADFLVAFQSW